MKDRFLFAIVALILSLAGGRALADDSTPDNFSDPDGSIALAEHFATFAHQTFHQKQIPTKALQLDAALYRAAMKLNPTEPRFPRALADILLELNDVAGATDALKAYMALDPADQNAQTQFVDLCLASDQMQSLDQRLTYLRFLLQKQQIPDPVKSEIAFRAARLLLERGQDDEALKLLDSARVLNPMNLKALRTRYIMTQADALPIDRVQQLLGILQANPADPVIASRLAEQLAQLGLVGPSITWYGIADQLYNATRVRADPAFVLGASSELLLGKHAEDAARIAARYTAMLPEDADGWFVLLSILKFQLSLYQDPTMLKAQDDAILRASIAISNRILAMRSMTGDTTATTRPVDSPTDTVLPDLSDDADRFKATQYRSLIDLYASSLESLAWLDLFYRHDAKAASPLIDDLARLVPPNDPTLLRLRAWQQYIGGDPKGALPSLRSLGAQDPLAALGAILIELSDPTTQPQAVVKAQKLLDDHAAGVVAAVIWSALTDYHLSVDPSSDSSAVATLAANVPQSFLQLVTDPHAFYTVQVTPLKSVFHFGEPILVRVTMQNLSSVNMAIGDDCAVHPELWFDAHLRGAVNQGLAGVAFGRLDQRFVLSPGSTVSTVIRVDQDALHDLFATNPTADIAVNLLVITNPKVPDQQNTQTQTIMAEPGICGYAQPSTDLIAREPTPVQTPEQRLALYQGLTSDDGGEKIRTMSVLAAYVNLIKTNPDPNAQAIVTEMLGKLHRVDNAGKDSVLAFQKYLLASLADGPDQQDAINDMANDPHWSVRMLSLQLAAQLGDKGIPFAAQLTTSSDPIIHDYASALADSLQSAPATQPSAPPAAAPQTSETPPP
jgi:tetratricopeptide (TPR) repeat protein